MTRETIRVDEAVLARLEHAKKRYDVETFDEALRHELGIVPGPDDLDRLAAYFPLALEEAVRAVVATIREVQTFDGRVEETESGAYSLVFTDPVSRVDVCCVDFHDGRFNHYRNDTHEWEQAAVAK